MALQIVYRLIAIQNAKRPKHANIKTFDMVDDSFASRDAALTAIGWPNQSGKNPDMTIKKFTKSMKDTASVEKIMILPLLKDDVTNKVYLLDEVDETDYIQRIMSVKPKEVRSKESALWHKEIGDNELDLEENYEKREKKSSSSSSTSSASVSG
jgi:hypothetical protein